MGWEVPIHPPTYQPPSLCYSGATSINVLHDCLRVNIVNKGSSVEKTKNQLFNFLC